jgi:hypothetical protein
MKARLWRDNLLADFLARTHLVIKKAKYRMDGK